MTSHSKLTDIDMVIWLL